MKTKKILQIGLVFMKQLLTKGENVKHFRNQLSKHAILRSGSYFDDIKSIKSLDLIFINP